MLEPWDKISGWYKELQNVQIEICKTNFTKCKYLKPTEGTLTLYIIYIESQIILFFWCKFTRGLFTAKLHCRSSRKLLNNQCGLEVKTEPPHITMILFYFDIGIAALIFKIMLYKSLEFL